MNIGKRVFSLNNKIKVLILISIDTLIISFSLLFIYWITFGKLNYFVNVSYLNLNYFLIFIGIPFYFFTGHYRRISRYFSSSSYHKFLFKNLVLFCIIYFTSIFFKINLPPTRNIVLFFLISSSFLCYSREIFKSFLNKFKNPKQIPKKKVVIYGAGDAGAQLQASLKLDKKYDVLFFIDDSEYLYNRELDGVKIKSPSILIEKKKEIEQVFLAIPSASIGRKKEILNWIERLGIQCMQTPSLEEISDGRAKIDALKPISIEDLLGRVKVHPDPKLIKQGISGFSLCITGGGGSIGSELCRQCINLKPKKLVIIEKSEPSLYEIQCELDKLNTGLFNIYYILGDATNEKFLEKIFEKYQIQKVIHAAAYKHVPLVEANPLEGIINNVFSTLAICNVGIKLKLKQIVLISTDKAVRPTNVMGATKRLSEIIIQHYAEKFKSDDISKDTIFSLVRFGNVLGSSGSVVPLFKKQIADGGPITLTHEDIIRYFMTIKEASQLVLQTLTLANNGDIFLLNMGEPVRIAELAKKMISLSGHSLKDKFNPNGEIEIITTGLRPGEKLFEELLINDNALKTEHPLIFKALENQFYIENIMEKIQKLRKLIDKRNTEKSLKLLNLLVPEWKNSIPY